MRKLTHKQFMSFDSSVISNPKTIEDLQYEIPVDKEMKLIKKFIF